MSDPVRRSLSAAPRYRPVRLGPREVVVDRRPDGTIHLRSPHQLGPYPVKLTERLQHWADADPRPRAVRPARCDRAAGAS